MFPCTFFMCTAPVSSLQIRSTDSERISVGTSAVQEKSPRHEISQGLSYSRLLIQRLGIHKTQGWVNWEEQLGECK